MLLAARDAQRGARATSARPSASNASASAGTWKLPFDSISPRRRCTSGLSAALLSSSSTSSRASCSAASAAPCTCVTQRNESGSCTRRAAPALPQGAAGEQLAQMRAAIACCPRAGRAACTRGSSGRQVGAKALEASARPRRSARRAPRAQSCSTSAAWPTVAALALISARPSLARERDRREPGARRAPPRRGSTLAAELGLALADERQREVRQRREVGDADRAAATARRDARRR